MRFGERAQARSFLLGRPGGVRLPGSGARCWVGLPGFLAWRVAMGLGELRVAGSKLCGLRTFPHRRLRCLATVGAGSAAAWKYGKPLVQGIGGLADSGIAADRLGGSRRYGPSVGLWVVWLGKKNWDGAVAKGRLRIRGFQNPYEFHRTIIEVQQPWSFGRLRNLAQKEHPMKGVQQPRRIERFQNH